LFARRGWRADQEAPALELERDGHVEHYLSV
jgi:hypothetical protein